MDDNEFKSIVKQLIDQRRKKTLNETKLVFEYGDEFGDIDLGGWKDLAGLVGLKDVVKTTLGTVANISSKAKTVVSIALKGLPSLIIPFVDSEYDKIYKKEEQRTREIARMYPEIFALAKKSFTGDGQLIAFMVNPVVMTTTLIGKVGGQATLDLIDALSGNSPDVISKTRPLRRRIGRTESIQLGKLNEDVNSVDVKRLLSDKEFIGLLSNSKPVVDIVEFAKNSKNETLNDVIDIGENISSATSIEDITSILGTIPQNILRAADEVGEDAILTAIKNIAFDILIKRLGVQIEEFKNLNVPEDSDLYRVYTKTIDRIRKMIVDEKDIKNTLQPTLGKKNPKPVA